MTTAQVEDHGTTEYQGAIIFLILNQGESVFNLVNKLFQPKDEKQGGAGDPLGSG